MVHLGMEMLDAGSLATAEEFFHCQSLCQAIWHLCENWEKVPFLWMPATLPQYTLSEGSRDGMPSPCTLSWMPLIGAQ